MIPVEMMFAGVFSPVPVVYSNPTFDVYCVVARVVTPDVAPQKIPSPPTTTLPPTLALPVTDTAAN